MQKRFTIKDVEEFAYQVGNLLENRLYQVSVTASTKMGESRPSQLLSAAPTAKSKKNP